MHHDARLYIEIRYDGQTADATIALFRDRGILPTEVQAEEFSFDSVELSGDCLHEAYLNMMKLCQEISKRR
jgi:hypothetical protein